MSMILHFWVVILVLFIFDGYLGFLLEWLVLSTMPSHGITIPITLTKNWQLSDPTYMLTATLLTDV